MKLLRWVRDAMNIVFGIFDDWLTRVAGIVFVLIIAVVIFDMNIDIAEAHPLLGTLVFLIVPVLFVVGGVIFVLAILRFSRQGKQGNKDGTA